MGTLKKSLFSCQLCLSVWICPWAGIFSSRLRSIMNFTEKKTARLNFKIDLGTLHTLPWCQCSIYLNINQFVLACKSYVHLYLFFTNYALLITLASDKVNLHILQDAIWWDTSFFWSWVSWFLPRRRCWSWCSVGRQWRPCEQQPGWGVHPRGPVINKLSND